MYLQLKDTHRVPNTLDEVINFLQSNKEKEFTDIDIARHLFESNKDYYIKRFSGLKKLKNKGVESYIFYFATNIRSLYKKALTNVNKIKTVGIRFDDSRIPATFCFYGEDSHTEQHEEKLPTAVKSEKEDSLYWVLHDFLKEELSVYSMRIDERRSSNRGAPNSNKWLHADLVGVEDIGKEWGVIVRECSVRYIQSSFKLWSFEVKTVLNLSNLRMSFFQTVANSSWANFGYLVCSEIHKEKENEILKELRMLSAVHGIGLITLDKNNIKNGEIKIPAREKEIDWDTVNRVERENKDFQRYLALIKKSHQIGQLDKKDWSWDADDDDMGRQLSHCKLSILHP